MLHRHLVCGDHILCCIVFLYVADSRHFARQFVAFNAHKRARSIEVPEGTYTVVCRNIKCDQAGLTTVKTKGGKVTIPAQSALIIHN